MMYHLLLLNLFLMSCTVSVISLKSNFVFILTDDQDSKMDSLSAMPKLLSLVGDKGATFVNSFVASPLCCPSRSGLLTGQYVHNHGAINNTAAGGCNSIDWQLGPEQNTFPLLLSNAGYTTFLAGKYLNTYGDDDLGGLSHIPPGWTSWLALKGNSVYYDYYLSVNGTPEYHGNKTEDYLTTVIRNEAINFIDAYSDSKPFFMMLSTSACHDPNDSEPQYENSLNSTIVPRTPNFNIVNVNKNWFVELGEQPLRPHIVEEIDNMYRKRLRTLLSVDDMVESIVQSLESKGFMNNTYIFYTSDNGYHLGQFSMPWQKSQPYEADIRVPLLVRGPGIAEGIHIEDTIINIDLAPTILDIAAISVSKTMDGISLKDVLLNQRGNYHTIERSLLIEHSGQGEDKYWNNCEYLGTGLNSCSFDLDCKCIDAFNNTYNCIRNLGNGHNDIYCVWDEYSFVEYYNIAEDPYQIINAVYTLGTFQDEFLSQKLNYLMNCSGESCSNITMPTLPQRHYS